jgi:transposase
MTQAKNVASITRDIQYEAPEPAIATPGALYIGIDIAKNAHVGAFISGALLVERGRFQKCPVLVFPNTRAGYEQLLQQMATRCPLTECTVLLESTGHYHKNLEAFLLEHGVRLYIMHVRAKPQSYDKSDRRDALGLALHIYNLCEKGIQFDDPARMARLTSQPSETARQLHGLTTRRYELVNDIHARQNKLTAILDEVFPEFTSVYKSPNRPMALAMREAFPTPADIAGASLEALYATRTGNRPYNAQIVQLKELAAQSIGTKDTARLAGMLVEQKQLIAELRLLEVHLEALNDKITEIISSSREGKILLSIPCVGAILAASVVAMMGDIRRFESDAKLKRFFGYAPAESQTGISKDTRHLPRTGSMLIKQLLYMAALQAISHEGPWKTYYDRMVARKCSYDERTGKWHGKMKVIGNVCGRIVEMMYHLLAADAELLASLPPGASLPEPTLYDTERHLAAMQRPVKLQRAS